MKKTFEELSTELRDWGGESGFLELPPFDQLRMLSIFCTTNVAYLENHLEGQLGDTQIMKLFLEMITTTYLKVKELGYDQIIEIGKMAE